MISPVVITTLNRYEHLKNCIESLKGCNLANETDIYISVDYPPSEKYQAGYERIVEYLNSPIDGFHDVHIYFQQKNLGSCDNSQFLYKKAFEDYDRLIYTEDDNEFSPTFLEYMNTMLERFKDEKSVYAICGYRWPFALEKKEASFFSPFISFWGCGLWRDKVRDFERFRRRELVSYLKNSQSRKKFIAWSPHEYKQAVYVACEKHHMQIYRHDTEEKVYRDADFIVAMYMHIRGMKVIVPYVSKVRNMGHDGSGENCDDFSAILYDKQEIDMREILGEETEIIELNSEEQAALSFFHESKDHTGIKERIKLFLMLSFMMH